MHAHYISEYHTKSAGSGWRRRGSEVAAVKRLFAVCCMLWFLNHLEALPIQNFTETRTKQNKQKPLGFSLFLWESSLMGTTSGELIVKLITQGLGFPWKEGCFSWKERDILHPKGTCTHPPKLPLLPFCPLLLSFYVAQPFFLKVPPVFFKESTPNKNFCHFTLKLSPTPNGPI